MSTSNRVEAAKGFLKDAWRATKAVATNKSKMEVAVEEACNDVPWGPTGPQMNEIAEACFNAEKFQKVWAAILKRFESEPAQWRRVYKALLLTEHLLKNSSQHVVQTLIDATGVIEGLKQFKYLDEKGKDHGINVSNRAKELALLLGDSDRIRAERAKAKALKEKLKTAEGGSFTVAPGGAGQGYAPAASPASDPGLARPDDMGTSSHFAGMRLGGGGRRPGAAAAAGDSPSGSPRPAGGQSLGAGGSGDSEGEALGGGPASAGKGYAALTPGDDPVAATAARISGLRASGRLGDGSDEGSQLVGEASGGAGGMRPSRSYGDMGAGGSQHGKPSLTELMARKSGGPKKLQEVRVNPAIAAAISKLPSPGKPAPLPAAEPLSHPPAAPPAAVSSQLPLPGAARSGTPSSAAGAAPALADLLAAPAPASPSVHSPSGDGSPSWGAFGGASDRFASPPIKPGAAGAGAISLTATAAHGGGGGHHALPAYLFSEPAPPPAYSTAGAWGTHVAGAAPSAAGSSPALSAPKLAAAAQDDLFADFNPLR